ncbi:WD40/YVTN/BNR-like repeat-containing protein [Metabacillus fastidiosus]|uniref:WD40/YVTN/BNR-like repeat-containing protein n=1 Tax=Metabacillus fastidiosus TaxID=1458 RepID=UPI003D287DA9
MRRIRCKVCRENDMTETLMATAVTRLEKGEVVLAAKNGIYIRDTEKWSRSLNDLNHAIRDLISEGNMIFGVGDKGIFIKSENGGLNWTIRRFPTKASIWSICSNSKGVLVTHGEKVLYVSTDYGDTWKVVYPFNFPNAPSIRSLCLDKDKVLVGTKIHHSYGGVWCYDLRNEAITRIKLENNRMIASLLAYEGLLIAASGSCKNHNGNIEFCYLNNAYDLKNKWITCINQQQQSFLDLSASNGRIYATSTQNKEGYSFVLTVSIESKEILPCNFVKGHGWRISSEADDYIVAGLYESIEYSSLNAIDHKIM